ncbi:MAG: hypothetical protein GY950_09165 [bacterium]|nr:hypothetical protein [bacterium]
MIKKHKQAVPAMLLGILAVFVLTGNLYPLVFANETDQGFDNPGGLKEFTAGVSVIRTHVIRGAGYFLEGYSGMLLVLKQIELSELEGLRYDRLDPLIADAAANIENARITYAALKEEAAQTPYNPSVILRLEMFDYAGFMEKHQLNPFILAKVEGYLSKGDIRGVYRQIHEDLEELLVVLYNIKSAVAGKKFPKTADLWDLEQTCSETLLFGQYVAQIFHEIM